MILPAGHERRHGSTERPGVRKRVWHSAGQEPTVPRCKGSAQRVVFPADRFLGDVPSAQHKIQPQTHQDLL